MKNSGKKKLTFLLSSSGQAFAAANVALGINKYFKVDFEYDINIFYNSFSQSDISVFQNIPNVVLRAFELPSEFVEKMTSAECDKNRFNTRGKLMTFCHFEIFTLLDKYKKVVWMDSDVSIQDDIGELADFTGLTITDDDQNDVRSQFNEGAVIEGYDLNAPAVCAAFIVVCDTLPYEKIYHWCYAKTIEYAKYLKNADQAILNLFLQEFSITPNVLPSDIWQCTSFKPMVHVAKIAHFGFTWKPWLYSGLIRRFPEWYRTHLIWLKLGGSDFPGRNNMDLLNRFSPEQLEEESIRQVPVFPIISIPGEQILSNKSRKRNVLKELLKRLRNKFLSPLFDKFGDVHTRMNGIDNKLDNIDQKIETLYRKLSSTDDK